MLDVALVEDGAEEEHDCPAVSTLDTALAGVQGVNGVSCAESAAGIAGVGGLTQDASKAARGPCVGKQLSARSAGQHSVGVP